ncbi:DUF3618 domain-containing protein [Actinocorallia longicatena]|uniref:DUF3618 domain-containing protein n=1 Tax=Actinocorallia longicatena TaxID=111803 RepID=A0ABP6QGL7_9ACTN
MTGGPHEDLHREIERTRQDLGDTVAALAAKADLKARAKAGLAATGTRIGTAAKRPRTLAAAAGVAAAGTAVWLLRRR